MSTSVDLRAGFDAELHELVAPLRKRLADVDEFIALHQQQLDDLRQFRREIVQALKPLVGEDAIPLEPGRVAKPGPKPGTKQKSRGRNSVAGKAAYEARLTQFLTYLRETYPNGDAFVAVDVARDVNGRWGSTSTVHKMVSELAERDQLALDHVGGPRNQSKFYRVVT